LTGALCVAVRGRAAVPVATAVEIRSTGSKGTCAAMQSVCTIHDPPTATTDLTVRNSARFAGR